jgi:hypothetical protein
MAEEKPPVPTMIRTGTYLGFIVVAQRAAIKMIHGPGGNLEGWPIDWGMAFCLAAWHAKEYFNNWYGEHYG